MMTQRATYIAISWVVLLTAHVCAADQFKAKYGPEKAPFATPLWSSNDYFKNSKHPAAQFWTLIPFYIPQFTHASCSVASITMTLNAARTRLKQSSEDKVISESDLLEQVKVDHWKERTASTLGYMGQRGVKLGLLGGMAQEAFRLNGFPKVEVRTVYMNDSGKASKEKLIQDLAEFEKNPDIYLIANFDQKSFTDDVNAGHISPVGAYDAENQKVLILDPDREYFSPYWVSLDTFVNGMVTLDPLTGNKLHRGYVVIQLK